MPDRTYRLLTAALAVLTALLIHLVSTVPELAGILTPLRLLQVLVHEFGHALATVITGGQVHELVINMDGSGHVMSSGGLRPLIVMSGYLGSAFFGSVAFYFNNRYQWGAIVPIVLGGVMVAFALLYGRLEATGIELAVVVALGYTAVIWLVCKYTPWHLGYALLNVLSAFVAFDAWRGLGALAEFTAPEHHNDAEAFSQLYPAMSGNGWAALWMTIAVLFFGMAFYFGIVLPLFRSYKKS